MDTSARLRRLLDGANKDYLNPDGVRPRNYIWKFTVLQAIYACFLYNIVKQRVETVEIFFDCKSLSTADKRVLLRQPKRFVFLLRQALGDVLDQDPMRVSEYGSRLPHREIEFYLHWSNEESAHCAETGLTLAHHLARYFRKDLHKNKSVGIQGLLEANGFADCAADITDLLLQPTNRRTVEKWQKDTGLPEPK